MHIDYHTFLQNTRYSIWCLFFTVCYRIDKCLPKQWDLCFCDNYPYGSELDRTGQQISYYNNKLGLFSSNCKYNPNFLNESYFQNIFNRLRYCLSADGGQLDRLHMKNVNINGVLDDLKIEINFKHFEAPDYFSSNKIEDFTLKCNGNEFIKFKFCENKNMDNTKTFLVGLLYREFLLRKQAVFKNESYHDIKENDMEYGWVSRIENGRLILPYDFKMSDYVEPLRKNFEIICDTLNKLKTRFQPRCESFFNYFRWLTPIFEITPTISVTFKNSVIIFDDKAKETVFYKNLASLKIENAARYAEEQILYDLKVLYPDISNELDAEEERERKSFNRFYERVNENRKENEDDGLIVIKIDKINAEFNFNQSKPFYLQFLENYDANEYRTPQTLYDIEAKYNISLKETSVNNRNIILPAQFSYVELNGILSIVQYETYSCFYSHKTSELFGSYNLEYNSINSKPFIFLDANIKIEDVKLNVYIGNIPSLFETAVRLYDLICDYLILGDLSVLDSIKYSMHGYFHCEINNFQLIFRPSIDPYTPFLQASTLKIQHINVDSKSILTNYKINMQNIGVYFENQTSISYFIFSSTILVVFHAFILLGI